MTHYETEEETCALAAQQRRDADAFRRAHPWVLVDLDTDEVIGEATRAQQSLCARSYYGPGVALIDGRLVVICGSESVGR